MKKEGQYRGLGQGSHIRHYHFQGKKHTKANKEDIPKKCWKNISQSQRTRSLGIGRAPQMPNLNGETQNPRKAHEDSSVSQG